MNLLSNIQSKMAYTITNPCLMSLGGGIVGLGMVSMTENIANVVAPVTIRYAAGTFACSVSLWTALASSPSADRLKEITKVFAYTTIAAAPELIKNFPAFLPDLASTVISYIPDHFSQMTGLCVQLLQCLALSTAIKGMTSTTEDGAHLKVANRIANFAAFLIGATQFWYFGSETLYGQDLPTTCSQIITAVTAVLATWASVELLFKSMESLNTTKVKTSQKEHLSDEVKQVIITPSANLVKAKAVTQVSSRPVSDEEKEERILIDHFYEPVGKVLETICNAAPGEYWSTIIRAEREIPNLVNNLRRHRISDEKQEELSGVMNETLYQLRAFGSEMKLRDCWSIPKSAEWLEYYTKNRKEIIKHLAQNPFYDKHENCFRKCSWRDAQKRMQGLVKQVAEKRVNANNTNEIVVETNEKSVRPEASISNQKNIITPSVNLKAEAATQASSRPVLDQAPPDAQLIEHFYKPVGNILETICNATREEYWWRLNGAKRQIEDTAKTLHRFGIKSDQIEMQLEIINKTLDILGTFSNEVHLRSCWSIPGVNTTEWLEYYTMNRKEIIKHLAQNPFYDTDTNCYKKYSIQDAKDRIEALVKQVIDRKVIANNTNEVV